MSAVFERYGVRKYPEGTRTAADAARAVGCAVEQIVKSLVFTAAGRPVLVLISGAHRVDPSRLAVVAGAPVEKCSAEAVRLATGFAIGGVPPFGHRTQLPVYIDRDLLERDLVWCAAGKPDAVFPIEPNDLVKVSGGQVAELKA
jgi:prolyl-tRNA editing enzyme YbaK/EbsC (Cys-tRNA(Pro) deacylase)